MDYIDEIPYGIPSPISSRKLRNPPGMKLRDAERRQFPSVANGFDDFE